MEIRSKSLLSSKQLEQANIAGAVSLMGVDPERLAEVFDAELNKWAVERPKGAAYHARARGSQLHGAPTYRVHHITPAVPVVLERAEGARIQDIDGHDYIDFSLSGSAALFGHRHPAIVAAIKEQLDRAIISDWTSEDAVHVTEHLQHRFGLKYWQFCLSASDANRFALRLARIATGKQKIVAFSDVYHGSLDETHAILKNGQIELASGVLRNGFDIEDTTRAACFNDIKSVERALAAGDVAAVLVEPVVTTRRSMVHPDPGFHEALRKLTAEAGVLLIMDETQTIVAGPGGYTREAGLHPDMLTMGKWAAGGLPMGMYGMTEKVADAIESYGGRVMGSTLSASAMTAHVMSTTLRDVMTPSVFGQMISSATRYEQAIGGHISSRKLPWHVVRLGARVAFGFEPEIPRTVEQIDPPGQPEGRALINWAIWLHLANRGVLISPWNATSIFCPLLKEEDVQTHVDLIVEAMDKLTFN
ncbi:transaminase [Devosia sp. 2618]|uniref:transaminase n=1 Tax=Devosia sp. 2618 TaxID=3156454 RepID=UPI0033952E9E